MIRVIQSIIIIIEADIRTDLITIHKQTLHTNIHEGVSKPKIDIYIWK